jgi:pyroglutamyl-peptidase
MAVPRTLLLTGFEPFGGDGFNPSGTLARALHGHRFDDGALVHGLTLPVSGPQAWQKLSRTIRRLRPHWIVATGVSGRAEISLESTAWNEDDFRIPDNAGRQPRCAPILVRGPARLESGIATDPLCFSADAPGLPIRGSSDPGRFVCNHLYYRLLHLTRQRLHVAHRRALFLHLPCTPEMRRDAADDRFFHPLEDLCGTVRSLLQSVVRQKS